MKKVKIGIIICYRYKTCAGGKCFRSAANREGAFSIYKDQEIDIAAFTTCGGCPGGNIESIMLYKFHSDAIKLTLADELTRFRYD